MRANVLIGIQCVVFEPDHMYLVTWQAIEPTRDEHVVEADDQTLLPRNKIYQYFLSFYKTIMLNRNWRIIERLYKW